MLKFVVFLRVKDGIFFVHEWLKCFERLADEIVVVDNGSTDGTYEALKEHPKVVNIVRTDGFNEGRDKNLLYKLARERRPSWCLWVDIDEVFEPALLRKDLDRLMRNRLVNKYGFRRFHFVDYEHFAGSLRRLNYSAGHDRIMWREASTGYFENVIIDSPNVKGIKGLQWNTNFRLKHLGYINKDLVDRKANIYRAIIPEKESTFQEMYMTGEKKIKWIDDRKNVKVRALNTFLSLLRLTHFYGKVINRLKKLKIVKNEESNRLRLS